MKSPTPEEVKAARKAAGLTQQQASELVGISIKSWQAYEGGWRNMRPATWQLFQMLVK